MSLSSLDSITRKCGLRVRGNLEIHKCRKHEGKQSEFRTLGGTARGLSTRKIVYVMSYGPQIYDSSTWNAPDNLELHTSRKHRGKQSEFRTRGSTALKLSTREIVYVISYGPQIYVSSTWDAPELRTTNMSLKSRYTRALHHGNSD